jgi:hypothetical protein
MPFAPSDLEIARPLFDALVGDDPRRALALDPVLRWSADFWSAFADTLRETGFSPKNPGHLAALQSLIDQACEAG